MTSYTRLALILTLRGGALTLMPACDDGEGSTHGASVDPSTEDGGTPVFPGNGVLNFKYLPMYSAYVEGHLSQLPVTFESPHFRNKGAKFSSSDLTIATVEDTPEGALVTVKRDGKVVIRAALDGDTGAARLIITKYTEALWKLGEARYNASESALAAPDGGVVSVLRIVEPNGRNPIGACLTCHSAAAPFLQIEDTPTQTAGYSDDELIAIFTKGIRPDWVVESPASPSFIWGKNHVWTANEEEQQGLLAYLRTKAPKVMPPVISVSRGPCRYADGGSALCDNAGEPIAIPAGPSGRDAGVTIEAGMPRGLDAGMAGDAG